MLYLLSSVLYFTIVVTYIANKHQYFLVHCYLFSNYDYISTNRPPLAKSPLIYASDNVSVRRRPKRPKNKVITQEELDIFVEQARNTNLPESEINEYLADYTIEKSAKKVKSADKAKRDSTPKILPKRLKRHLSILPEKHVEYRLEEAIDRIKVISGCKFVEGLDVAIRIPLTKKRSRSTAGSYSKLITLPYPSLKSKRSKVGVFADKDICEAVLNLGFSNVSFAGGVELIEKIKSEDKLPDVNLVLSDAKTFHKLSIIGKLLGRRGLMPSIDIGTCMETKTDILERVNDIANKNTFVMKSDKTGDIKCNFADVSMPTEQIRANLLELVRILRKRKPPYSSQKFISKIFISSSMGPSFMLSTKEVGSARGFIR
ncbi:50S ribosomal protein L1p, putative [Theileria equi strain WA]|uniref:50S ribosomal protein L1p, putative n=1 Tax=Theileria equi strain WA TaxID=1537102 RepID=L1LG36_THEEQ|nr:50S ribosomal protein L1p, putative [Theileria equi strain WA]EKX74306.1 50S ribosomal protein L1p, putative [Theileria equi strain WA]|eukprot:XP_004833758.1 50S ribosomal protein L1p, putative [Theileria equi strain WA]